MDMRMFQFRGPARPGNGGGRRAQAGFTMLELLITLAVAAVLAALAFPSLSSFAANQRAKAAASTLFMGLMNTRSNALKLGSNVTFKPVTGTDWTSGWQIVDTSSNVIAQQNFSRTGLTGPTNVVYQSSGRISATTAPSFAVSAVTPGTSQWCVSVDPSGRPYIKASSC